MTGMAGQIISTIHGMDVVNYEKFETIAAHQYGIDSMWLERALNVLQECDLVSVEGKINQPESIHVKSKYLKSNYAVLSEHLIEDLGARELELSTIDILQTLALTPLTTSDIKDKYNLDSDAVLRLKFFGQESQLLQFTQLDPQNEIISTPMYWDENATAAQEIITQFSSAAFVQAMERIKNYQGTPTDISSNNPIFNALVTKAILPTPIVKMNGVDHPFLFTPYNTKPEEKIVLEKARDILACVRCGQHFATYPINNPLYILRTLRSQTDGYRLRPTTVAKEQYFLLASKGIGMLDSTGNGWYSFRLIDTPENLRAVNLAIELLSYGEIVDAGTAEDEDVKKFLGTRGISVSSFKSIKEANKKRDISPEMTKELFDCIQGVYMYKGGRKY
ncbi:hypothetical protein [Paenibacillus illinoisensis]|uniref:hypothetical protein n=1 Tax=Paenibacillus illinoisensis TaxID=59845 RepID=UPI00203D7C9E|nr:hypothetical protein [Paenibacillus illinoisensis]